MGLRILLGLKRRPPPASAARELLSAAPKDRGGGELLSYYLNNPGRPIHRWLDNFPIYERHFARFRNAAPVVLEIGVKKGGSLDMWRHYFGPSATIIGVDINQSFARFRDDGFLIEIGDQGDAEFWQRFKQKYPRVDVLIDDGGHRMDQQRVTFLSMFPHLSADGVYLCEDLHTSYWAPPRRRIPQPGELYRILQDSHRRTESVADQRPWLAPN